jgi:hypothetical protein
VGNRYTTVKPTGVVLVFVVFVGFVAVGGGFIDPFPTPLLVTLGSKTRSGKKPQRRVRSHYGEQPQENHQENNKNNPPERRQ